MQDFEKSIAESIPILNPIFKRSSMSTTSVSEVIRYAPLVAGAWKIAGIGAVVVTAGGTILVAGVAIGASFWAYTRIRVFFTERAYNNAKKNWTKTNNHSKTTASKVPTTGQNPYSSKDQIRSGKLHQRRYYDKNGNADLDVDYSHAGNHKFPHSHTWNGKVRSGH